MERCHLTALNQTLRIAEVRNQRSKRAPHSTTEGSWIVEYANDSKNPWQVRRQTVEERQETRWVVEP